MEKRMLIEGPLKIAVLDDPEQQGRELHISFTPEFQVLEASNRASSFADYLALLGRNIETLPQGDPNRAGMLIVQQIAEQLLPHLQTGDLAISETIIVEMGRDYASDSLMGLLNS
jgi:hypothetical protein